MKYFAQEQKTRDEQSRQKLVSGVHCDVGNIITEFLAMKAACNKMDEINFCQYVQFSILFCQGSALVINF